MQGSAHRDEAAPGGRVFFSNAGRSLIEEDQIELLSVGVDIGSSTSHLMFSTITLERDDTRYVVSDRKLRHASEILLTPYSSDNAIDAGALGAFIAEQYRAADLAPDQIDTGALVLTGVAARRTNARAIGQLFAAQAGKFVAVSAGDALETIMAAHGSGAVAASREGGAVINVDVGGGTTKIAICRDGQVTGRTALDVGARLIVLDPAGTITRLEPFGAVHLESAGLRASLGQILSPDDRAIVARNMADRVFDVLEGRPSDLLRLPPLEDAQLPGRLVFSGGVAEYLADGHDPSVGQSDDLGADLAAALWARAQASALKCIPARQRIRATVVGASQYTVQVSGSTIFVDPEDALPLRDLAVIAPKLVLPEVIDPDAVASAVTEALIRLGFETGERPVAVAVPWSGSASYGRLSALGHGLVRGLGPVIEAGHPVVLVVEGDIGGLLGMQCRTEENLPGVIVSIDGIGLGEFDFIDIGAVLRSTGAAPVVVKSLLFPSEGS